MHIGKNISKIRELLGIKQEALAASLKISQQTISKIEQTAHHSDKAIERIAHALGVNSGLILNYDDNAVLDFIKGEVKLRDSKTCSFFDNPNCLLKIIELYERLILSEKEKFEILSVRSRTELEKRMDNQRR